MQLYPTLKSLAEAEDEVVFKLWEGLGYYSRCRNILFTARFIANLPEGQFPHSYEEILSLRGIGPYTAAAISSFAYGLPHAVVDGNVFRVLARYFGETISIDSAEGKKRFKDLAQRVLYKTDTASFNQAIMDFGATVCKPKIATCNKCILQENCVAFNNGLVNTLPFRKKKLKRRRRWFYYFIFTYQGEVLLNKRAGKDIWQNLSEFFLYEADTAIEWSAALIATWLKDQIGVKHYCLRNVSSKYSQQLTHQHLEGQFFVIDLKAVPKSLQHLKRVRTYDLKSVAFPKFINEYLENHPLKNLFE
jgi:A/G-specific adenine glycosylase